MSKFTTKINLIDEDVFVSEFKVKHFKTLLKTLLGDTPDTENIFANLVVILSEITSLSVSELKSLSILNFLLLLLYIRCLSIGSTIQLEIKDKKNTKVTLDLTRVIDTLNQTLPFDLEQTYDNFKIKYKFLSVNNFLFDDVTDSSYLKNNISFITIKNNQKIQVSDLSNNDFLLLLNHLPAKYSTEIYKNIVTLNNFITNINLFEHLKFDNLYLYLNRDTFSFFMQILFSNNLMPLYENIFALCKFANLPPEYVENCTPGEYTIFVKLLEQMFKEQAPKQSQGQLPPINPNSPTFM
jgi:hypothetical protein